MLLKECKLCPERNYGQGPVPGYGDKEAKICLLGRNPGVTEDRQGKPFVGRAGVKLNEGLAIAGLKRPLCWVDNVVKCMTPKDVSPSQQCLKICAQTWLEDALESLANLEIVLTLGNQALHFFEPLGTVGELHGTVFKASTFLAKAGGNGLHIFVSYHPSAALRSSLMNKHFVADMEKLNHYLHVKYPEMVPALTRP